MDPLVLDEAVVDGRTIGHDPGLRKVNFKAKLLAHAPPRGRIGRLTPMGMGAAGIRPQPTAVIFGQRPPLDQQAVAIKHEC